MPMPHPLARAALVAAFVASAGAAAGANGRRPASHPVTAPGEGDAVSELSSFCPEGALPDGDGCVPIPADLDEGGDALAAFATGHHDKRGVWRVYDQIPRRPDRPADYGAYRYPIPPPAGGKLVMSGYDLDLPDDVQRRARTLSHVGHGGIDLAQARGTEVHLVKLEHQEGDAQIVYAGKLFGTTVVTRHSVREGGRLCDYLLLHGHLDRVAPGLEKGQSLPEGALLGFVGDSASPGIVHLHLEARRVRDGVDPMTLPVGKIAANEATVVCDPRNVLPLR